MTKYVGLAVWNKSRFVKLESGNVQSRNLLIGTVGQRYVAILGTVLDVTGINCVENGSGSISGPGKPGCQAQNVSLFWAGPCGGLLSGH